MTSLLNDENIILNDDQGQNIVNINNIKPKRKYVKKSEIYLVNFPWEGNSSSIDVTQDVEIFDSLKTIDQVRRINEIKDNFDLCVVVSPAGARIAYLADLNFVWYFVGDAIRAPLFVKNVTDNLVLKQPYYNLNFLERRFYKWVYDDAIACVAWGEEIYSYLKKYRSDGIRMDRMGVDTSIFNDSVKPIERKKDKFTFFSPQRIGLPKGYDVIWKALPLCKSDFEILQVNWYDKKTAEEQKNSQHLLDTMPKQVKLIPMMGREELARYYAFTDAVIGQMKIGIGAAVEREAAMCKKPVLQYSNPDMRYMINGNEVSEPFLPKSQDPQELADLIDNHQNLLQEKMHVRVELNIDISYEEANFIKETFIRDYHLREMALIPNKNVSVETDLAPGEVRFESVDQIVTDQLTNIESEFYDPKLLLQIYQTL